MEARCVFMRCPHLDRLGRDLTKAYRSLENREVFALTHGTDTPGNDVSLIHAAMAQHRRTCPICRPEVAKGSRVERTIHLHC